MCVKNNEEVFGRIKYLYEAKNDNSDGYDD